MISEHTFSFTFERSDHAPWLARRALRDWLLVLDCPARTQQDMLLVISELVTNAVIHAQSAPAVVASYDDGRLRLEVHDQNPAPPEVRADGDGVGGYGLRMVSRLTDRWGWEPTPTGKRIWSEMHC